LVLVPYAVKAVIKNKKMKKVLDIKPNRYLQGTYLRFTALKVIYPFLDIGSNICAKPSFKIKNH